MPTVTAQQSADSANNFFQIVAQKDAYYDSLINIRGIDSMQGTGYKDYLRWKTFAGRRIDEDGSMQTYMDIINNYYHNRSSNNTNSLSWSYYGPIGITKNIDISYGKGWIYCINVNKDNHNIIYAGAHNSGLYKTMNGGKSWHCLTNAYPEISGVKSIAIPQDDTATIYILTVQNMNTYFGGLYKSVNSGQTWEKVDIPFEGETFYPSVDMKRFPKKVIIHPDNENILFVLANHFIMKTIDGGNSWSVIQFNEFVYPGDEFEDIIFDAGNHNILYASGTHVYKSDDLGTTWNEITADMGISPNTLKVCTMSTDNHYPGFVWFFATFNSNTSKIYKYDPNNNSYTKKNIGNTNGNYLRNQISISPVDTSIAYYGTVTCNVFAYNNDYLKSYSLWHLPMDNGDTAIAKNKFIHHDIRSIKVFSSDSTDTLFIANDGGIRKAWCIGDTIVHFNIPNYIDTYKRFDVEDLSTKGQTGYDDLNVTELFAVSTSEREKKVAFNCQDVSGFINSGQDWYHIADGDGGAVLIDETNPDYLYYADYQGTIFRVFQNDKNKQMMFVNVEPGVGIIPFYYFVPFEKHPVKKERLYFGTNKLYYFDHAYTDGINDAIPVTSLDNVEHIHCFDTINDTISDTVNYDLVKQITDIEISHNNPDRMYVSTNQAYWWWSYDANCNTGDSIDPNYYQTALFKSDDGGSTWTDISAGLLGLDEGYITDIELNPYDDDEFWLTFAYSYPNADPYKSHKIYHSSDAGQTYEVFDQGMPAGLPVWELVYDPFTNDLYVATDVGVFKRNTAAQEWENINEPFEDAPLKFVYDIEINQKTRTLYASTFGKGLWSAPLGDCPQYSSTPLEIRNNTTWSAPKHIVSDVIVKPGAVLTITDMAFFNGNAKLIVEPGGKLELDGGVLTNSCDTTYWQGVEVWGQSNEGQTPDKQGWIVITNHGTIENAVTGILAGSSTPDQGPVGYGGGIIHAVNADFINNIDAVEFVPYNKSSVSRFERCSFITNAYWPHQLTPDAFISMDSYQGLRIKGCNFVNNAANIFAVTSRGIGIHAINSEFTVDHVCVSQQQPCTEYKACSFDSLYYGIYAMGTNSEISFNVRNSVFNNYSNVYLSAIDNAEIVLNDFTVPASLTGINNAYGLYLDHCTGYHIEANDFTGDGVSNYDYNVGIYVNNSGTEDNLIYNNTFYNLYAASVFQDVNRRNNVGGLKIKCNDYSGNISDIDIVTDNPFQSSDYGIAEHQGYLPPTPDPDPTLPAGNTFSKQSNHKWDIYNELNGINYVYHNHNTTNSKVKPADDEIFGNVSTSEDFDANYTKSKACPSMLSGGGEQLKVNMYLANYSADSTHTVLLQITDGGNTQVLLNDINTALPGDGLTLRNMLLNKSPWLSDTVMISAVEKEDVLSAAMIRDILVENPQAAKSVRVQNALDRRADTLPAYMRQQINAGRDTLSPKEMTESALTFFNQKKENFFNRLRYYYGNDTMGTAGTDSIKKLYANSQSLTDYYRLALLNLVTGDTTACDTLLNALSSVYNLNAVQETQRQNYVAYINLIKQYGTLLDSTAVASLKQIAQNQTGLPSVYARNLLVWVKKIVYKEPVLLPDTILKSTLANGQVFLPGNVHETEHYLLIKPNPAHNYFTAAWNLPAGIIKARLIINGINGQPVEKTALYGNRNEKLINTGKLPAGTYLISLSVNGKIIETKKLDLLK